jgi:hypothetical protein
MSSEETYDPGELVAKKIFVITLVLATLFCSVVFAFIL